MEAWQVRLATWNHMEPYRITWNSMEYHRTGTLWNADKYHHCQQGSIEGNGIY